MIHYDRLRKWAEGIALTECCGHKKCRPDNPLCHAMGARVAIGGFLVYQRGVLIDELGVVWRYGNLHGLDYGQLKADGDETDEGGEYFIRARDAMIWLRKNYGLLMDKMNTFHDPVFDRGFI